MIASLLPGLRDLRVPLAGGFLWLVVLWLCVYPVIPDKAEAAGLAGEIYTLLGAFGPAALLAVVTFIAYLLGILLVPTAVRITDNFGALREVFFPRAGDPGLSLGGVITERTILEVFYAVTPASSSTLQEMVSRAQKLQPDLQEFQDLRAIVGPDIWRNLQGWPEGERNNATALAIFTKISEAQRDEIPLVATRLLAHNRELFDRYDRADAEASFRFAIPVPLVIISALVAWRLDLPWWGWLISIIVGLTIAWLLIVDGRRKRVESNDAIFQAVFIGEAEFPSIQAWTEATADARKRANGEIGPLKSTQT